MASGDPPLTVCIRVLEGTWEPPRWLGVDPKAMFVLIGAEACALITRFPPVVVGVSAIVILWYIILLNANEKDPKAVSLIFANRRFWRASLLRCYAIIRSRKVSHRWTTPR